MPINIAFSIDTCTYDERAVFGMMSFCVKHLTCAEITYLLNKSKIHNLSGKAFIKEEVSSILETTKRFPFISPSKNGGYALEKKYSLIFLRDFINHHSENPFLLPAFNDLFKSGRSYAYWFSDTDLVNAYVRLFQTLLLGSDVSVNEALASVRQFMRNDHQKEYGRLFSIMNGSLIYRAFAFDVYQRLDEEWFSMIFSDYIQYNFLEAHVDEDMFEVLSASDSKLPFLELFFANYFFLQGHFDELFNLASRASFAYTAELSLWARHLCGEDVMRPMDLLLQKYASVNKTRQEFMFNQMGAFWQVPYLLTSDKTKLSKITKAIKDKGPKGITVSLKYFTSFFKNHEILDGSMIFLHESLNSLKSSEANLWEQLAFAICYHWVKADKEEFPVENIVLIYDEAKRRGAKYLQLESAHILDLLFEMPAYAKIAKVLKAEMGVKRCLSDLYTPPTDWELKLNMLADFASKSDKKSGTSTQERLVWLLNEKEGSVQPILQKHLKNGGWSKGRNVALSKIFHREVACATAYDEPVFSKLVPSTDYYGSDYEFSTDVLSALVGHPLLFFDKAPDVPVELEEEEIELIVEEIKDSCKFSLSRNVLEEKNMLIKQSTNNYKVVVVSPSIENIWHIIGSGLTVPKNAKPRVLETLKQLSGSIKINSPLIGSQTGATLVEASTHIYIHLLPLGNGIKADVYVKPLSPEPPYVRPAEGLKKITGHSEAGHIFADRNFEDERDSLQQLMDLCPVFASQAEDDNSALFDDPAECLQVLSEFREAGDAITVEWPRGQKFSIKSKVSLANFSIRVKKQNSWFDLQGDITVDDDQVLSLVKMMELLDSAKNRFVEIEPGVFIELEKHFIRQLEYLKTVADVSTKQIKLHPLAAVTNAGLFDSAASFTSDNEWNTFIETVRKSEKEEYPLPKGIEADLRPYQLEGYRWLRKMADWGTGACLADDMGLGKTLQCIALLQSRASSGPSLVIAPTSVCPNWISEIEKFAPSLIPVLFGSTDRRNSVETIDCGGILVVSYGLLATEAELLASRSWNVFILDEAHAIKNMATKRSQVAMSIDASFRIAATGTPLQNHMGELWNLFQFLNPGLLGSQQSFGERFVIPIEKSNDELARRSLKDLIKPFILRRTKNQVLHDLPEKTEITMPVEFSPQERTFYEALRVKALEEIQKLDNTANAGEKQMRVLAEIMKLRMACCHSSLANKDINIDSSKLARFEELAGHLIENGHKALVFSQFIGHLSLMRNVLDRKGIVYEYLDGSTPQKDREERIRRFQAGSADMFLISLKAGGVGLNLTAADYVIHMDPWWNPAVEDQASDRAHRIGQTKPVTIYRLVTKDTIEDKIVDLHKNKRDLADSLLEGTEAAAKVTADELIGLLKGF